MIDRIGSSRFARIGVAGLCLVALGLGGCAWKGGPQTTHPASVPVETQEGWLPQATAMRVFPGGGLREREGRRQLELRIELLDAMGDAVKASGDYQVELFTRFRLGETVAGQSLGQWNLPVRTLDEHRRRYDPITRTYQVLLNLPSPPAPGEPLLAIVTFHPLHGGRLVSRAVLEGSSFRPLD